MIVDLNKDFTLWAVIAIINIQDTRYIQAALIERGDHMPNGLEITKAVIDDFQKVQAHMKNAKEENATKTYEGLKKDYKSLKAMLQVSGVNLTDIDEIKE